MKPLAEMTDAEIKRERKLFDERLEKCETPGEVGALLLLDGVLAGELKKRRLEKL